MSEELTEQEQIEILSNFAEKLLDGMKPLDPDIAALLDEDFWSLI